MVAVLPQLYTAIQEQLADQQKTIAPAVEDAIAATMNVSAEEHHSQDAEYCAGCDTVQTLQNPEDVATGNFSHYFYEDATSWELREQLNDRGYKDAIAHQPPAFASLPYMAGYSRWMRDRPPVSA